MGVPTVRGRWRKLRVLVDGRRAETTSYSGSEEAESIGEEREAGTERRGVGILRCLDWRRNWAGARLDEGRTCTKSIKVSSMLQAAFIVNGSEFVMYRPCPSQEAQGKNGSCVQDSLITLSYTACFSSVYASANACQIIASLQPYLFPALLTLISQPM